jgi:hypothetical protein
MKMSQTMSAESAALRNFIVCRTFGAHPQQQFYPGLAAGPIFYRAFGP